LFFLVSVAALGAVRVLGPHEIAISPVAPNCRVDLIAKQRETGNDNRDDERQDQGVFGR
jgi:hypothetical protein